MTQDKPEQLDQENLKRAAGREAIRFVVPGQVIGVGTGTTVDYFIEALGAIREHVPGAVSSSERSAARLRALRIPVLDLNDVDTLDVYIDGADEITRSLCMTKGGGGALTREKIVAAVAKTFVCIADQSKLVASLGGFPLPVEIIPMARTYVMRELAGLGGSPRLREGVVTDNGNQIVDVAGLRIDDPTGLEDRIGRLAGVVTVGLFARRRADVLLLATHAGVETLSAA